MKVSAEASAVEWLVEMVSKMGYVSADIVEQAKEMQREQHGKTWDAALDAGQNRAWNVMRAYEDFDDYFAEKYNHKKCG